MQNTNKSEELFVILTLCLFILLTLAGLYISFVRWE